MLYELDSLLLLRDVIRDAGQVLRAPVFVPDTYLASMQESLPWAVSMLSCAMSGASSDSRT